MSGDVFSRSIPPSGLWAADTTVGSGVVIVTAMGPNNEPVTGYRRWAGPGGWAEGASGTWSGTGDWRGPGVPGRPAGGKLATGRASGGSSAGVTGAWPGPSSGGSGEVLALSDPLGSAIGPGGSATCWSKGPASSRVDPVGPSLGFESASITGSGLVSWPGPGSWSIFLLAPGSLWLPAWLSGACCASDAVALAVSSLISGAWGLAGASIPARELGGAVSSESAAAGASTAPASGETSSC